MDKASRALRRSGVKIMSMNSGHSDLSVLVSDVGDVKSTAKAFMNAQHTAANDMMRWAAREENRAVQDVVTQIAELSLLWSEVQKDFADGMKDYRAMFEKILDGEKQVSQAKSNLDYCSQKEVKLRKEIAKAAKRATSHEMKIMESRLSLAERERELAQVEVSERVRENEAVKLIRLKEGMMKMSGAYIEMSGKCNCLFTAQRDLTLQLPDVHGRDLECIKYSGFGNTRHIVEKAKDKLKNGTFTVNDEPPPPYMPPDSNSPMMQASTSSRSDQQTSVRRTSDSNTILRRSSESDPSFRRPSLDTASPNPSSSNSVQTNSITHTNIVQIKREVTTSNSVINSQTSNNLGPLEASGSLGPPEASVNHGTPEAIGGIESHDSLDGNALPSYQYYVQDPGSYTVSLPEYSDTVQRRGTPTPPNIPIQCQGTPTTPTTNIPNAQDSPVSQPIPAPRRSKVQEEEYDTAEEDEGAYLETQQGGANN